MTADRTPLEQLAVPAQLVKGVGPQRAELLARLDLFTARDLLFNFPRDYLNLANLTDVRDLKEGQLTRLRGTVEEFELRTSQSGRSILGVLIRAAGGSVRLLWFNQSFLREKFAVGQEVLICGKPKLQGLVWQIAHPHVQWLETTRDDPASELLPVYSLTEGLHQGSMRHVARTVVEAYADLLEEVLPDELLSGKDLVGINTAIRGMHLPQNQAELDLARRRLIYQELLVMQLALAVRARQSRRQANAPLLPAEARIDARIRRLFPFELTADQDRAIREVAADMGLAQPMNRLLQGDVGSGKTVIAVYALLLTVAHGFQAALMAPTEILARQHAATLTRVLAESRVRWALLTGGLSAGEREITLQRLAAGDLDLVIGTQAVVQEDVRFARLGLVVIDEQHKFGVRQRATLRQAGLDPHYLVMTATPIPRTVAMTVYGDLEVSILRESPPGRQPVKTYLATADQRERWWEFFRKKLREGRQGFVVTPLVEDSAAVAATSLDAAYETLVNGPLADFRLAVLHGRMSSADKESAMQAFRRGQTQVLVATSVIEVGVDVPNATLLAIEAGERFGLSQLHQLRGRIGRGAHPGFCCVFTEVDSPESQARLEAFAANTDGFELAEIDFRLRGPGDLLGTRQHGLPPLRVADLARDAQTVAECRHDAKAIIERDPGLSLPEYERLRKMVLTRYGKVLDLGDVA